MRFGTLFRGKLKRRVGAKLKNCGTYVMYDHLPRWDSGHKLLSVLIFSVTGLWSPICNHLFEIFILLTIIRLLGACQ